MGEEVYILCAVFAVAFVWHLVRGRFKEALFVFGLFLLSYLLLYFIAGFFLNIAENG